MGARKSELRLCQTPHTHPRTHTACICATVDASSSAFKECPHTACMTSTSAPSSHFHLFGYLHRRSVDSCLCISEMVFIFCQFLLLLCNCFSHSNFGIALTLFVYFLCFVSFGHLTEKHIPAGKSCKNGDCLIE